MGFFAHAGNNGGLPFHDYIQQQLPEEVALLTDKWYYGEFYVSRSDLSSCKVREIGLYMSVQEPTADWFNSASNLLRVLPASTGGTYATAPPAQPQVHMAHGSLAPLGEWVKISGCFRAQGGEKYAIIGNFVDDDPLNPGPAPAVICDGPQPGPPPGPGSPRSGGVNGAYYFVDDVRLSPFPYPLLKGEETVACGEKFDLYASCPLPESSGATYYWTNDLDPTWQSPVDASPFYQASLVQTTTYTLHVVVPTPGGQPATDVEVGNVTVQLAPDVCRLDCTDASLVVFDDLHLDNGYGVISQNVTFAANTTYLMPDAYNIRFEKCMVIVEPGAVLLFPPNRRMTFDKATLWVKGGTLTAACDALWDGIYLADPECYLMTEKAPNGRRAEISHSENSVQCDNSSGSGYGNLYLFDTNFLYNLRGITCAMPANTQATSSTQIVNCFFGGNPAYFKRPYASTTTNTTYSFYHLKLSGDWSQATIADNYFAPAWLSLYAPGPLKLGQAQDRNSSTHFTGNTFDTPLLAGIYCAATPANTGVPEPNALYLHNNVFLLASAESTPRTSPDQLNELYGMLNPAHIGYMFTLSNRQWYQSYGLFVDGANLSLTSNGFVSKRINPAFPYVGTRHVGAWLYNVIGPLGNGLDDVKGINIRHNNFSELSAGLEGLFAPAGAVVDNLFKNCDKAVLVTAGAPNMPSIPSTPNANTLYIACNTFERSPSTYDTSHGQQNSGNTIEGDNYSIYVVSGATLTMDNPRRQAIFPQALPTLEGVMGNKWLFMGVMPACFPATCWPTQHTLWNMNYVSNNSSTLISYRTFYGIPYSEALANSYGFSISYPPVPTGQPEFSASSGQNCAALSYASHGWQRASTAHVNDADMPADGSSLFCSPNPASTELSVEWSGGAKGESDQVQMLTLINLFGQSIHTVLVPTGAKSVTINVAAIPDGLYVCRLSISGQPVSSRRVQITHE